MAEQALLSDPKPTFPYDELQVIIWKDPLNRETGYSPRSEYVETFWLPIIGPTTLLLLRKLSLQIEREPEGFQLLPLDWIHSLGLAPRGGRHGPLWKSLDRACRFRLAQMVKDKYYIKQKFPMLNVTQISRLPEKLQTFHAKFPVKSYEIPHRSAG